LCNICFKTEIFFVEPPQDSDGREDVAVDVSIVEAVVEDETRNPNQIFFRFGNSVRFPGIELRGQMKNICKLLSRDGQLGFATNFVIPLAIFVKFRP
jgi:hypothetical protein